MSHNAIGHHEFDSHSILESTQLKNWIYRLRRTFHESNRHLVSIWPM